MELLPVVLLLGFFVYAWRINRATGLLPDQLNLTFIVVGVAISVAFLALVIARVDLAQVGAALGAAPPAWLLVALGVMAVDLMVRATRWRALLAGLVARPRATGMKEHGRDAG